MSEKSSKNPKKVVMVSGGFDPVHIGHVRMFVEAKKLGDVLVVVINNDNWLRHKKGFVFMPQEDRMEIILAFESVDEVVISGHPPFPEDMSVCIELAKIRPHIFANGGDRDIPDAHTEGSSLKPEYHLCDKLNIQMVFNVGHGGKVRSSTELVKKMKELV